MKEYCNEENIPVLSEIPDDRRIAEIYSRGEIISLNMDNYREEMLELAGRIEKNITTA